ncbi:hypothetical protein TNCV_2757861 [Trichonephila clavipes]|nr:hypothetical protein TNCV_2757861 [Trichonephila clavipes]
MAPHRPRKSAPTEYATDEEDMITYDVEDKLDPNPADNFFFGQYWRNNPGRYVRAVTPARFRKSRHELEPSTTKYRSCMGEVHVKSVESFNVLLWSGVVVQRGKLKYRPRQPWFKITRSVSKSPRVAEQCDVNIHSLDHESSLKLQLLEQSMTALPANNISVILVKSISDLRPLLRSCTFE